MGAWLGEQIVRAIEPEDPDERERYWARGGFFTAPFRAAARLFRGEPTLPAPRPEHPVRRDAADPPR